jgi:hypothetical protein
MKKLIFLKCCMVLMIGGLFLFQGCETEGESYTTGVRYVQRIEEKVPFPDPTGPPPDLTNPHTYTILDLEGPGSFISAQAWKKGGDEDDSYVILEIDGRVVVEFSFIRGKVLGFTQGNPFGIASFDTPISADNVCVVTMAFSTPLYFEESLKVHIRVTEPGVKKLVAEVIFGGNEILDALDIRPPGPGTDPGGELP